MTPSLGSVSLLEQLTELREIFYLLDNRFIIKRYNSGTTRSKRFIWQGMGGGKRIFHVLSRCSVFPKFPCIYQHWRYLNPVLKRDFTTNSKVIKLLASGDWFNAQAFSPPLEVEVVVETEMSHPLILAWFSWNRFTSLGVGPKVTSLA